MKDHLLSDGTIRPWQFGDAPLPPGSDGRLVDRVYDAEPLTTDKQTYEPGIVEYDQQNDVTIQRWAVRDLSPDELRYVIPPEVFREQRLTKDERQTIRHLATQSADIADLWEKLLTLKEGIISDDPLTIVAKAACGQIFGADRANELFARP